MLTLVLGILTGWERLGFTTSASLPHGDHGAIMIGCFLGGLIMLERAVSLGKTWAYAGSVLCVLSLILILAGESAYGYAGITMAAFVYILVLLYQQHKLPEQNFLVSILGGFCLLTANTLLFIHDLYPLAVNWWIGFLLFTILGERLSVKSIRQKNSLLPILLVSSVFIGLLLPFHHAGAPVFGTSLILLGLWLLYSENVSFQGMHFTLHMNTALLFAYVWLIITGGLMLAGGLYYDAHLHSFYVGFVFSMIFGHAPLMIQRVLSLKAELYHPLEFVLLLALQISLVLRISGSIAGNEYLIRWGGLFNGIIILLFLLTNATVAWNYKKKTRYERY
jgi:hypothetical protein